MALLPTKVEMENKLRSLGWERNPFNETWGAPQKLGILGYFALHGAYSEALIMEKRLKDVKAFKKRMK